MRILITGGGSDIGQAIAQRRAEKGDDVIVTATRPESLETTLSKTKSFAPKSEGFVFNFAQASESLNELEVQLSKGIDAVVLNAFGSLTKLVPFHEMPFEDLVTYTRANIECNLWLLQKVLPHMQQKKFGRLVLISSLTTEVGTSNYAAYGAAKAALEAVFLNLAVDYGHFGITANTVKVGIIKTSRTALFWKRQEYRSKMSALIPQGELGDPAQVAEALDPLLSPTSYISGTSLRVSGGLPLNTFGRSQ